VNINGGSCLPLRLDNSTQALLFSIVQRVGTANLADNSGTDSGITNANLYVGNDFFGNILGFIFVFLDCLTSPVIRTLN